MLLIGDGKCHQQLLLCLAHVVDDALPRSVGIAGACAWITKGYTIEDYVPAELLTAAVAAVHPNASLEWDGDRFQNPLAPDQITGSPRLVDKIAIANYVATRMDDPAAWPHDLKDRVKELVKMVRAAND